MIAYGDLELLTILLTTDGDLKFPTVLLPTRGGLELPTVPHNAPERRPPRRCAGDLGADLVAAINRDSLDHGSTADATTGRCGR